MSTNEAKSISPATNWREAAKSLITYWVGENRCFSSGEVAAVLRTHRQDLHFSVTVLGEYTRDLFYRGEMPRYTDGNGAVFAPIVSDDDDDDDDGITPTPVNGTLVQHPRYTEGNIGRTPAGVQVFVYGPSVAACDVHEFEVNIPSPGGRALDDGPTTPAPKRDIPAAQTTKVRPIPEGLPLAYVGNDGRCYVARKVVDAYLGAAGVSLSQGDAMFVIHNGLKATITATSDNASAVPYNIWKGSGRIAFHSNSVTPFTVGDKYAVSVDADGIVVDLSRTL